MPADPSACSPGVSQSTLFVSSGARRRRCGGGPGEGYARKPVGTYLYLHAMGAGSLVAGTVGG
jgi:hypothetical protein